MPPMRRWRLCPPLESRGLMTASITGESKIDHYVTFGAGHKHCAHLPYLLGHWLLEPGPLWKKSDHLEARQVTITASAA